MAMDIIPKAIYPVVPNAPGVPALLRDVAKIADTATLGLLNISGALDGLIGAEPVRWGIFNAFGQPVAIADSIISVEYRNGSRISDYPMEQGAFASYNKVANPYDVRVRMSCSGSQATGAIFSNGTGSSIRADFLAAIEAASRTLDLYTVVTPEATYTNANIEHWDYRREVGNGSGIIIADVYLREIRETATAAFLSPKSVGAADPKSQGQVQTFPVSNPAVTVTAIK